MIDIRPIVGFTIATLAVLTPNPAQGASCEASVSAAGNLFLTREVPDPLPPQDAIRVTVAVHATETGDVTGDPFIGTFHYTSPSEGIRFHAESFLSWSFGGGGSGEHKFFTMHFTGTVNDEPGEGEITITIPPDGSTPTVEILINDGHGNIFGGKGALDRGTAKITTCL